MNLNLCLEKKSAKQGNHSPAQTTTTVNQFERFQEGYFPKYEVYWDKITNELCNGLDKLIEVVNPMMNRILCHIEQCDKIGPAYKIMTVGHNGGVMGPTNTTYVNKSNKCSMKTIDALNKELNDCYE